MMKGHSKPVKKYYEKENVECRSGWRAAGSIEAINTIDEIKPI